MTPPAIAEDEATVMFEMLTTLTTVAIADVAGAFVVVVLVVG